MSMLHGKMYFQFLLEKSNGYVAKSDPSTSSGCLRERMSILRECVNLTI